MKLSKRQFSGIVAVQHRYNALGMMQNMGVIKQSAAMDDILRDAEKLNTWLTTGKRSRPKLETVQQSAPVQLRSRGPGRPMEINKEEFPPMPTVASFPGYDPTEPAHPINLDPSEPPPGQPTTPWHDPSRPF